MILHVTVHRDFAGLWLDRQIERRFGLRLGDRMVCRRAGVQATTLYRIVTRGERPSDEIVEKLARTLEVPVPEFRRRMGLDPVDLATDLSFGEKAPYLVALHETMRRVDALPVADWAELAQARAVMTEGRRDGEAAVSA